MINPITPVHYEQILEMNQEFVHWLSPLDEERLKWVLSVATYKRQIDNAKAILFGYAYDADYPDHKNMTWLNRRLTNFFYIDRIIVESSAHGQGYGKALYADLENFARNLGYAHVACEVNTAPNNPSSHKFHEARGYIPMGDENYPTFNAALRYYSKPLS